MIGKNNMISMRNLIESASSLHEGDNGMHVFVVHRELDLYDDENTDDRSGFVGVYRNPEIALEQSRIEMDRLLGNDPYYDEDSHETNEERHSNSIDNKVFSITTETDTGMFSVYINRHEI